MTAIDREEQLLKRLAAYREHGSERKAAEVLGIGKTTMHESLVRAAALGMMGYSPVLPGFRISAITNTPRGDFIKQRPDVGAPYAPIDTLAVRGRTTWADIQPDGSRVARREVIMERADSAAHAAVFAATIAAMKDELPRAEPVAPPVHIMDDLLCQYTITDAHLGAMAWNVETGGGDYDLSIGEKLILDWFAMAVAATPPARRAVFAQLGDFLHHDSFKSITPEHGHLLDADSRYSKMVRVAIRVVRQVIRMLLAKHGEVHVIMADANHDPASEVWLREMFAVLYEDEPRLTVDTNPGTYSLVEHGDVSLFYHHGHRRDIKDVDSVFVGKFRQAYGRTRFSYAHIGHKHSDELKSTNLMKVERHETLAAPDAYAANGGWLSGRSAKVIYYHARRGEVGRNTITAEMVADAPRALVAANDNEQTRAAA